MRPRAKGLMAALGAALAASLLLNVFLAGETRRWYGQDILDRISVPGESVAPSSGRESPVTNLVLLMGDSRVVDWDRPVLPGWRVVNAGIKGATTAQVGMAAESLLARERPAMVVVEAGINDLKLLGVRPELRDEVVRECVANLRALSDEAARRGGHVLLCKVWPAGQPELARRLVWNAAISSAIEEVNRQLDGLTNGCASLETFDCFSSGISPEWRRDALHLRPAAYAAATEALRRRLSNLPLN